MPGLLGQTLARGKAVLARLGMIEVRVFRKVECGCVGNNQIHGLWRELFPVTS